MINLFIRVIQAMYVESIVLNPSWKLFRIAKVFKKINLFVFTKTFDITHDKETDNYSMQNVFTRESHRQVLIL